MPSFLPGTFGALLLGTWVNVALYTLELAQVKHFFAHYNDPFLIRAAVLGAMFVDTLCTAGSCAAIYLYTITNWGNEPYLASQYWPIPVYVYSTGITAAIVQMFLIYRIWILSKNRLITPILCLMAGTAFISSMVTATWLVRFPTYAQRHSLVIPATIWFTSSAVSDISVAIVLVWQLQRMKTSFKSTQSLVHRLMATSLKSGSATAGIATLTLILYLQDNQSNIAVGFAFTMGRVYSLTMLYNLNTRKRGRHTGNSGGTETTSNARHAPISLSGIQVSRSVHVNEDLAESGARSGTVGAERKHSEDDFYATNKVAPFASV